MRKVKLRCIPTVDRLFWVNKEDLDADVLKNELTASYVTYSGELQKIELYEETPTHLGVPRRWGIWRLSKEIIDETVFRSVDWPRFIGEYWPGQEESINEILKKFIVDDSFGTLFQASPGSGKTIVSLSVASKLMAKTLVIVNKNDLASQWLETGKKFFGVEGGRIQGKKWDYKNKLFTVATIQTLWRRKEQTKELEKEFGLVIWDEAHHTPAQTFEYSLKSFSARYRLCVSATFRRADGLESVWEAHVGVIGHIAKVKALTGQFIQIKWVSSLKDEQFRYKDEWPPNRGRWISAIAKNDKYNNWLVDQVIGSTLKGRRTILVSDRVDQLLYICGEVKKKSPDLSIGIYSSSVSKSSEALKCQVILTTYSMAAEGTDIPELDTLILATPRTDIEQTVGRIQRPVNKKSLLVVDPVFNSRWNEILADKRRTIYTKIGFVPHVNTANF